MPTIEDDGKTITCRAENPKVKGLFLDTHWKLNVVCKYPPANISFSLNNLMLNLAQFACYFNPQVLAKTEDEQRGNFYVFLSLLRELSSDRKLGRNIISLHSWEMHNLMFYYVHSSIVDNFNDTFSVSNSVYALSVSTFSLYLLQFKYLWP